MQTSSMDNTVNWYWQADNYGTDGNIQNIPVITKKTEGESDKKQRTTAIKM